MPMLAGGCIVTKIMNRLFESLISMLFKNVCDECKTRELCERLVEEKSYTLMYGLKGHKI